MFGTNYTNLTNLHFSTTTNFLEYAERLSKHTPKFVRSKLNDLYTHSLNVNDKLIVKDFGTFYYVYKFPKYGYVIKVSKWDDPKDNCLHYCPLNDSLIAPYFLYPIFKSHNESVIVQEMVDVRKKKREWAFREICFKLNNYLHSRNMLISDIWSDAHDGNVGVHKGVPVIIDFSHKFLD